MVINGYILAGYALFLLIVLLINLLYIFQVFKYRLPGDASLGILGLHIALMIGTLIVSSFYVSF